jgi:translation initiation factor IF-3
MINGEANTKDRKVITDSVKDQYLANYMINQPQVRLIDASGANVGVINTREALHKAQEALLDLVLVNSTTNPPIARICEYDKFIYEIKRHKKEQERKLRENTIRIKEIQLRPSISTHDLEVKMQHAKEWLTENCKIKIVVKFRGREVMYKNKSFDLINVFVNKLGCKIEKEPNLSNNTIIALVAPAAKVTK